VCIHLHLGEAHALINRLINRLTVLLGVGLALQSETRKVLEDDVVVLVRVSGAILAAKGDSINRLRNQQPQAKGKWLEFHLASQNQD